MSARGHRPRLSATKDISKVVGGINSTRFVGVGDFTRSASSDPADIVIFDLALDDWLGRAYQGANIGNVAELRRERQQSRA